MHVGIMGPIGIGKSTLTKLLADYLGFTLMEEPVASNKYLPLFYKDKEKFAFLSQNAFYSDLLYDMWQLKDEPDVIYDSTILSNLVFVELLRQEGLLDPMEVALTYAIANKHFELLGHVDKYVCFVREPETMKANVLERDRTMERGQEEYLDFHYANYYVALKQIIKLYNLEDKVQFVQLGGHRYEADNIHVLAEVIGIE